MSGRLGWALGALLLLGACDDGKGGNGAPAPAPAQKPILAPDAGLPDAGSPDAGGGLGWIQHYGSPQESRTELADLASVGDGGFVAAGLSFGGTFGGPVLEEGAAFVLARYDAEGAHQWTRAFPPDAEGRGPFVSDVAVAPTGEILTWGFYDGAPDLGGGPLPDTGDGFGTFLALFSADGAHRSSRGFVVRTTDTGDVTRGLEFEDLAGSPDGSFLLTGAVTGEVGFGGVRLRGGGDEGRTPRLFLARLGPDGTVRWARTYAQTTAARPTVGTAVASDSTGQVLVAGFETSPEGGDFDLGRLFVARVSPEGDLQWLRRVEGPGTGRVDSLAAGADGTVYFAGGFGGQLRFAGQVVENLGARDVLLGAFGADGKELWVHELPGRNGGVATDVVVDDAGRVIVLGRLFTTVDLGTGPLFPSNIVAAYTASGDLLWVRDFDLHIRTAGIVTQPGGRVVLGGSVNAAVELGGELVIPTSPSDLLFLQLLP